MVFSKRAASVLAVGFFTTFMGVILPQPTIFLLGAAIIAYVSINWLFYSATEKALFTPNITVSRDLIVDSRDFNTFTNKKIPVTVSVKNNTYRKFGYAEITDIVPESFEIIGENSRVFTLDEKSEFKYTYFVIPTKRGEYQFPGTNIYVSDPRCFFYSEKFFRLPVKVTVYPSIEEISIDKLRQKRSALRALGIHSSKQLGIGTDFAGIREYIQGDSFKKIEWKSTARVNKLMTREFESEVTIPSLIFLDVSPSMDSGKAGYTKLDYAIKTAVAFSKFAIDSHDPVGLYTFSDKLIDHLPHKSGKKQLYMILRTLAKVNPNLAAIQLDMNPKDTIPDEYCMMQVKRNNFETKDANELIKDPLRQVGFSKSYDFYYDDDIRYDSEYAMAFGLVKEFLCKSYPDVFDKNDSSVDLKIKEHVGKLAGLNSEEISILKWNNRFAKRYLIEFCIKRGLQLPLKVVDIKKENGLNEAIKTALTEIKGTALMVILSDLEGLNTEEIKSTLKLARQHHHNIMILAPFTPWFESEEKKSKPVTFLNRLICKIPFLCKERKDLNVIIEEAFSLKYSKTRKKLTKELSDIGIPVLSLSPEDFVIKLLSQLVKMKQRKMVKV